MEEWKKDSISFFQFGLDHWVNNISFIYYYVRLDVERCTLIADIAFSVKQSKETNHMSFLCLKWTAERERKIQVAVQSANLVVFIVIDDDRVLYSLNVKWIPYHIGVFRSTCTRNRQ